MIGMRHLIARYTVFLVSPTILAMAATGLPSA
jgi:hypothetical protein